MVLSSPDFPTVFTAPGGPFSSSLCHLLCSPDSVLQVCFSKRGKQWTLWIFQSVHHASKFWSLSSPQILILTSSSISLWLYLEYIFSSKVIYPLITLLLYNMCDNYKSITHWFSRYFSFKFVKMLSHLVANLIIKELFLNFWLIAERGHLSTIFGVLPLLKVLINQTPSCYVLLLFCLFLCFLSLLTLLTNNRSITCCSSCCSYKIDLLFLSIYRQIHR